MKRVAFITGASGFLGSHLAKQLLSQDWVVHIIVRPNSGLQQLKSIRDMVNVHVLNGELSSLIEILKEARPDVVFHLASLFISEHKPEDVSSLILSNVLFSSSLLEAMNLAGIKNIVNTGTAWQNYFGQLYDPVNLYAATKQAFQDILSYYVYAQNFNSITLKLCDTYGPNDPRRKLIKLLINAARSREELVLSPGDQEIDFLHVDDVVRAFIVAAEKLLTEYSRDSVYSISSGRPITIKALVGEIENLLGLKIPIVWGGRPYRDREVMKALPTEPSLPNWKPIIELRVGLKGCQ
jgi:nucleoside-diphosphate-sugar epimerase